MASLPPRPETTPKPRDDRRPPPDDRDRDRDRLTASRLRPAERERERERLPIPEHDRPYVPRKSDSYVPGSRRESDRRDYDDRDRRPYVRDRRDYDRSPRRRSPDRRPYERERPYRRSPSPYRRPGYSRRDSRSPPRYRRRSRTPPRQRPRSRTRSPRRPSPIRLGNHSIAPSPRERSPHRSSSHRNRSRSPDRRLSKSSIPPRKSTPPAAALPKDDVVREPPTSSEPRISVEEKVVLPTALEGNPPLEHSKATFNDKIKDSSATTSQSHPSARPLKEDVQDDVKVRGSEHPVSSPAAGRRTEQAGSPSVVVGPSAASIQAPSLPSPASLKPPNVIEPPRGPSHGMQSQPSWQYPPKVPRSPPRAPRGHRPPLHQVPHAIPPQEPRRAHGLPTFPKYERPKQLIEFEHEISRYEMLRRNYAINHLNEVKELRRALHELDMTSIDLRAAENRHRIADLQLEKAKAGVLGIDAVDIVEV